MKTQSALSMGAVGVSIILAGFYGCSRTPTTTPTSERLGASAPGGAVPITISSTVPNELNEAGGGAPKATMQQAAAFAWQEFIALNWPAVSQTGGVVNNTFVRQRDVPDNNCKFGDPNCAARPLVWETFRGKVEIFPGLLDAQQNALPPPGYPSVAPGDDSYGYDALPTYNYASPVLPCNQSKPSPTNSPTPVPSFINLDETDQITLDSMFAGIAPSQAPDKINSSPQLIRFLAKANRVEYTYVASPGAGPTASWWEGPPVIPATQAYLAKNQTSPPAGGHEYVSLPFGTIEIKAGWRVLNDAEIASKRFKTATARYYENLNNPCYNESTFGLVSLHIIQKTQSAPYFIYATFEQADNIMTAPTATASPTPVEDVDGNIVKLPPCRADQTAPCPTTPSVTLQDTPVVNPNQLPPQINLVPASAAYCTPSTSTPPAGQLYYLNSAGKTGLPRAGFICVNYRDNPIPQPIIDANNAAHTAMKNYNQSNGIADSPFLYYKLVNVQYMPIDKQDFGLYTGNDPNTCQNPACYYLANSVVETNYTLQLFSSSFLGTGSKSEYESQFTAGAPATAIHKNLYYAGAHYNMGGCMGCHGSQGQQKGGDFSVILATGSVSSPEPPAPITPSGAAQIRRNRVLKY
jgi:hypothetical protein